LDLEERRDASCEDECELFTEPEFELREEKWGLIELAVLARPRAPWIVSLRSYVGGLSER
jgi:hypothetical protein